MRAFLKTAIRAAFNLGMQILCVGALLPALTLALPFRRLRMGVIIYSRIGHLALDIDIYMRRRQLEGAPPRTTDIFVSGPPANCQLLDMWKRQLTIVESPWLLRAMEAIAPIVRHTPFWVPLPLNGAEHVEFTLGRPTLTFTAEEEERGQRLLHEMGINASDWFVCIHARTSAYLKQFRPEKNWDYHDFRDCDIRNYLKAAQHITSLGGYVVRMGTSAESPLPDLNDPRIIDYATRYRSDFMDIYLMAKCRFALCNSSGLMCVARIFDTPIAPANYLPFMFVGLGAETLYSPKLLRHKADGRYATMSELKALGLLVGHTDNERLNWIEAYDELGLFWQENSEDEILELCKDIIDKLDGKAVPNDLCTLQEAYLTYYDGTLNGTPYAGRIAPSFAKRHADLIKPPAGS